MKDQKKPMNNKYFNLPVEDRLHFELEEKEKEKKEKTIKRALKKLDHKDPE